MRIYGAYTCGIDGHLLTVSAVPNPAGRLHVAGVRDTVAQHTAATVTHALKRLGIGDIGADVRLEPAGPGNPPLATGQYTGTVELPIALALLAVAGKIPADRIADVVAVGGLDPFAANERAGVRCIGGGGTTAIADAAETRGLRLIVAEDQAAAARVECRETTGAVTLEELVAVVAGDRDTDPLPPRTAAVKRRDPGAWRISENNLRALEIACAGWHNIHVIGRNGNSLPQYGSIAQALLPDLAGEAARETTRIHGVAGLMEPWTARITEPPLRIPHYTISRGAVAGSRGRPGEANLAHNGVLVIDQPTEFDRDTKEALAAVAEDGQTVIYRHTPAQHTIRMPARFRLMVTTRPDELNSRRHRAQNLLDRCDIEVTGGMPSDTATPPQRLRAGRERIAQAAAILEGARPRLVGGRAAQLASSGRIRAVAQTVAALDGRQQVGSEDLAEAERLLYRGDRR
ncbi:MAG: ATP-binding protein [Acidobacteria bacterium]|nr:ATP-binding protein [Acidobacteriota bacterium]